jgi:hypothetical protein
MIGFVYISDIPKIIICIVIGIILLLIWGPAIAYFFPYGGIAAGWLWLAGLAGTFLFSWWAGTTIWEEIDTRLYWRKLQRTESRKVMVNIPHASQPVALYTCPYCQNANPAWARFCSVCGKKLQD